MEKVRILQTKIIGSRIDEFNPYASQTDGYDSEYESIVDSVINYNMNACNFSKKTCSMLCLNCLKQEKITFNYGKTNIFIVYEIEKSVNISSYPTLENCLFGAVKLTKHVDVCMYKYSEYGIGFDRKRSYSIGDEVLSRYEFISTC